MNNYIIKVLIISILVLFDFSILTSENNISFRYYKYLHPVHLSFTNIEYFESEKKFKILFKIFVDDFDKIILNKYNFDLGFQKDKKNDGYKEFTNKYIKSNFNLKINDNDISKNKLIYDSHIIKKDDATVWLYYSLSFKGNATKFEIKNTLMTDLYPDQNNLLIFNYKGFQKAIKFDNNHVSEIINLN
ncbi:MAG: hypothetical protein JXR51_06505 [Bacteroidales bacterium]|nr:hypothetical protein [Bacteroidales bacterium]